MSVGNSLLMQSLLVSDNDAPYFTIQQELPVNNEKKWSLKWLLLLKIENLFIWLRYACDVDDIMVNAV